MLSRLWWQYVAWRESLCKECGKAYRSFRDDEGYDEGRVRKGLIRYDCPYGYDLCSNKKCYGAKRVTKDYPQGWASYPGDMCPHGMYTGGCGIDWMCGYCESGEEPPRLKVTLKERARRLIHQASEHYRAFRLGRAY